MQSHTTHLHPEPFALVRSGQKCIESRLNDEKRRTFAVGDTLSFISRQDGTVVTTTITALHTYETFAELFENIPSEKFGGADPEELLRSIKKYYSAEDESVWGVVGIEFERTST